MPHRELRYPRQIQAWLEEWGDLLTVPGEMILIGSGALLWHAWQQGLNLPLPENSMDVDPITESEEIALLGYDALIGSEFEKKHGWHVNLMPRAVLREFPADWRVRAKTQTYGFLTVVVPSVEDLLIPKLKRGEPRDIKHAQWAKKNTTGSASLGASDIWGPYANYDDIAKLEYGRMLWKSNASRQALLSHWTSSDHPQRERFLKNRQLIEEILDSKDSDTELDSSLRGRSSSLRVAVREIPSIFGSFYSSNSW